jgi:LPS export ABC transporter permease LptG
MMRRPPGEGGTLTHLLASAGGLLRRCAGRPADAPAAGNDLAQELGSFAGTSTRFVSHLDRYIGLSYLRMLGYAVASGYLIYGLVEFQSLMDDMVRTTQSFSLVLEYFTYFTPTVLHIVLPISCLVGAIVAVTLLARTGELVAIKAGGISMLRATTPLLFLTVLLCGLLFLIEDRIAPAASRKARAIKDRIEGRAPRMHGMPVHGRWSFGPDGKRLYHYRLYEPGQQEFVGLSVFTLDRAVPRILDHRFAERARWDGTSWHMRDGWYRSFSPDRYETYAGEEWITVHEPGPPASEERRLTAIGGDLPEQMTLSEIRAQIATLLDSGYDVTRLRIAYWSKFSRSSAPLVMVLLGLPFAFKVGRRGSLYAVGVALLLVLVYWATFAVFNALGLETLLRPAVAAWAPNVIFTLVGVYLLLYVRT